MPGSAWHGRLQAGRGSHPPPQSMPTHGSPPPAHPLPRPHCRPGVWGLRRKCQCVVQRGRSAVDGECHAMVCALLTAHTHARAHDSCLLHTLLIPLADVRRQVCSAPCVWLERSASVSCGCRVQALRLVGRRHPPAPRSPLYVKFLSIRLPLSLGTAAAHQHARFEALIESLLGGVSIASQIACRPQAIWEAPQAIASPIAG